MSKREIETKRSKATRRSFLKAVGTAAAALPFFKMLEHNVVRADGGALPLRFVGFGKMHCTTPLFYARQSGETNTSFDISYADCPLRVFDDKATYGYSFKNNLIVFEGFDYAVGEVDPSGNSMHVPMHGALGMGLTGSSASGGSGMSWNMQNASLDQLLAAKYGDATRFRSVELFVDPHLGGLSSYDCIAFGDGGKPLDALTKPTDIWDKYFAQLVVPQDPQAQAQAMRRRQIGASILDFVMGDIQRLNSRLAGAEKQKLDQHLTAVRGLEKALQGGGSVAAQCVAPPRHNPTGNSNPSDDYLVSNLYNGGAPYYDKVCNFNIEALAQILICDLTRFATFVLPPISGEGIPSTQVPVLDGSGTELGAAHTDLPLPQNFHDSLAHKSSSKTLLVQQSVASMNRYFYGKIATLMQRLADAQQLDNTLILCVDEGGHGAEHSTANVPILLCGGANGTLQMGKRVVAPGKTAQVGARPTGDKLVAHNSILVAVANAFGANLSSFGTCANSAYTAGVQGLI
jgi:hypothetical protein